MSHLAVATLFSLPLLAVSAVAAAQPAPAVETPDTVFPTMGADGTGSSLGGQIMLMNAIGKGEANAIKRLDLGGQLVNERGFGGYAAIGASFIEDIAVLGSLEVGGLLRHQVGADGVTLRAGLILPTNTSDSLGEWLTHAWSTRYSRPSDYLTSAPDITSLRLALSPSASSGSFVARGDFGVDIVLHGEEADGVFVHADLGAGARGRRGALLVELSTMMYTGSSDELVHVAALTGELHTGKVTPYLTVSRPFQTGEDDDGGEGFLRDDLIDFNVAIGVRGQL